MWVRARACWNAAAREPGAAPVVVIVGAGFCGLGVLKALQQQEGPSHVHVVLIDKKDYFEFSPFLVSRISACGLVTVRPAPPLPTPNCSAETTNMKGAAAPQLWIS